MEHNSYNEDDDDIVFPTREVKRRAFESSPVNDTDEGDEGSESSGSRNFSPPWFLPEPGAWLYEKSKKFVYHKALSKKILLEDLNSSQKVIRLLVALENDKNMDADGLIIALEEAAYDCFHKSLSSVLSDFSDGTAIQWNTAFEEKKENNFK